MIRKRAIVEKTTVSVESCCRCKKNTDCSSIQRLEVLKQRLNEQGVVY